MNDCITTTKQSTTKPCAYFLGYTVLLFVCLRNIKRIRYMNKTNALDMPIFICYELHTKLKLKKRRYYMIAYGRKFHI